MTAISQYCLKNRLEIHQTLSFCQTVKMSDFKDKVLF